MRKNIVIAMLMVIIAGLSILLHRAPRISKRCVTEMSEAIEKQNQICRDLGSQVRWLRRHLEKTLGILETEYGLEPIPLQIPYALWEKEKSPSEYSMGPDSFVIPYQKPEHRPFGTDPNELGSELGLFRLTAQINLSSLNVLFANADMEILIDNLCQRLQRLEPKIEAAKK